MSAREAPRRQLPENPSAEHLRKQAKRLAKAESLQLAEAQRRLARDYGHADWAALMRAVEPKAPAKRNASDALGDAAEAGDFGAVERLLTAGAAPEGTPTDGSGGRDYTPLHRACRSNAPASARIAIATRLLDAGVRVRAGSADNVTALHIAARHGPLALVELLIRRGAFTWQTDKHGKDALAYAREGTAPDRDALIELLDRPVIRDSRFKEAVAALHRGDAHALTRLLDAHPRLLRDRAIEPDCYPRDYFRDPKLFWFVANNPILVERVPNSIVDVAKAMIARGVEQADLDYTIGLAMSGDWSAQPDLRIALVSALVEGGARVSSEALLVALAHWQTALVEALLAKGLPMTTSVAAALGRAEALASLLATTTSADLQEAFGLAVINRQSGTARHCLDAGADVNAFLPVHKHSTPLHQAAINDDLPMMELLLARGARADIRDTLWNGTPLGWAIHNHKAKAEALLRAHAADTGEIPPKSSPNP